MVEKFEGAWYWRLNLGSHIYKALNYIPTLLIFYFETGFHYIAQFGLEPVILLP